MPKKSGIGSRLYGKSVLYLQIMFHTRGMYVGLDESHIFYRLAVGPSFAVMPESGGQGGQTGYSPPPNIWQIS